MLQGLLAYFFSGDAEAFDDANGDAFAFTDDAQEDVFGADGVMTQAARLVNGFVAFRVERIEPVVADETLGSVLKYREDLDLAREQGADWLVGAS